MTVEKVKMAFDFPFKPAIIQAYGKDGEMWCWMSDMKDEWEIEIDRLRKASKEQDALISFLKSFGASDREIIEHIRGRQ